MTLSLSSNQLDVIKAHAGRTYPHECCGLLLGQLEPAGKVVRDIRVVENAWDEEAAHALRDRPEFTKTRRYWIAPEEMLAAMRDARQRNLDIIGIYHSHPDYPAVPSECDRRLAWSQYSYVIVSVIQGSPIDAQSWVLDEQHHFQAEAIQIIERDRMRRKSQTIHS